MPNGTTYSQFDADNHPHHVEIPPLNGNPATSAEITYSGGQATYTYPDGTRVTFDVASSQVVKQVTPDGWTIVYTDGKPASGSNSRTGQTVAITPDGKGGSIWTYSGDGPVIWRDQDGKPYQEVANGWTFNKFDSQGRPTDGFRVLGDGTIDTVHIDYDIDAAGDTRSIYTDHGHTTTVITNSNGVPLSQAGDDGVFRTYEVLLTELKDAIGKVSTQRDIINSGIQAIGRQFSSIHDTLWTGPGSDHFYGHIEDFTNLSQNVATVLSESIQRMEQSYNNYVDAEKSVYTSLTPISVESSPKFGPNGQLIPPGSVLNNLNLGHGPVVRLPPGAK